MVIVDIKDMELKELIKSFLEKGGRIDGYYLKNSRKGPGLVFYKHWYRGRNVREAVSRAMKSEMAV